MVTGYEVQMYRDIQRIAGALERIATVMESDKQPAPTTPEDIAAMGPAIEAVRRGMAYLEEAVREKKVE